MQHMVYKKKIQDMTSCENTLLKNGSGWTSLSSTLPSETGAVD